MPPSRGGDKFKMEDQYKKAARTRPCINQGQAELCPTIRRFRWCCKIFSFLVQKKRLHTVTLYNFIYVAYPAAASSSLPFARAHFESVCAVMPHFQ